MTEIHLDLAETTVDGPGRRLWSLERDDCPELAVRRIKRLDLADAAAPCRRVRVWPTGSFFMACHEGRGDVLLDARLVHHWIELAHDEAKRVAQPREVDDRLWTVWDEEAGDLAAEWTLESLAARYHTSKEQFRRVGLRELGRSPKAYRE